MGVAETRRAASRREVTAAKRVRGVQTLSKPGSSPPTGVQQRPRRGSAALGFTTVTLPESDGIAFATTSIATEAMREGATYRGVRVKRGQRIVFDPKARRGGRTRSAGADHEQCACQHHAEDHTRAHLLCLLFVLCRLYFFLAALSHFVRLDFLWYFLHSLKAFASFAAFT